MTNDFYKGMGHMVKSARDYAAVVKKNYESKLGIVATDNCLSAFDAGGAAAMRKMIEYLDIFDSFLKEYDNESHV